MLKIKDNLHLGILGLAFFLTLYTYNAPYNFGRLIPIAFITYAIARFVSKKKPEYLNIYYVVASLVPLAVILNTLHSENIQKELLSEINQTVDETIKLQTTGDSEISASVIAIKKLNLKPAKSNEELLRDINRLIKVANAATQKNYEEQRKVLAVANFEESLTPNSLRNQAGLDKLSASIRTYEKFLDKMESELNIFNQEYRQAAILIGSNQKSFMSGFEESFEKSKQEQNVNLRIQRDLLTEFRKIVTLLQSGYSNRQIKYDPSQDKFVMLDDWQLNQYNKIVYRIQELAKEEGVLMQSINSRLRGYQADMDKVLKK